MKFPTFVILIVCFASIALADDFKTINGKKYKDATVSRIEGDGIVLKTKSGISKGVSDSVRDGIWPGIPQSTEWQRIGN